MALTSRRPGVRKAPACAGGAAAGLGAAWLSSSKRPLRAYALTRSFSTPSARPLSGAPSCSFEAMREPWNSPSLKFGPAWQAMHWPAPDEQPQAALRRDRVALRRRAVAAREPIAEGIERRALAGQRFLVGRQRLAGIDHRRLVVGRRRVAEGQRVQALEVLVIAQGLGDVRGIGAHLARIEHRPDALRPQRVVAAVPAEPVLQAHVEQAGVLRAPVSAPRARARPSVKRRHGSWQLAQRKPPTVDRRVLWNSASPSAAASARPETRLLASRTAGGGQGPSEAMLASSSGRKGGRSAGSAAQLSPRAGRARRRSGPQAPASASRRPAYLALGSTLPVCL